MCAYKSKMRGEKRELLPGEWKKDFLWGMQLDSDLDEQVRCGLDGAGMGQMGEDAFPVRLEE